MFHFRKDFTNLTRDYAAQDEAGLPEITASLIADDASEFTYRTRAQFSALMTRAAVAAVFSTIAIEAGVLPVRVLAFQSINDAAGGINMSASAATLITANAGTVTPRELLRGQAAATAVLRTGTAAAATNNGFPIWANTASTVQLIPSLFPFILRPGEFLSIHQAVANLALVCGIWYEELQYALLGNPPNLT